MGKKSVRNWLLLQGVTSDSWLDEVIGGFDFSMPVYEQVVDVGEYIYQYVRNSSSQDVNPSRGSWFCLCGARNEDLSIIDGLSGRHLIKFRVEYALVALEGVAKYKKRDWAWAGGGKGGGTQMFIPPFQIARIQPAGRCDRW